MKMRATILTAALLIALALNAIAAAAPSITTQPQSQSLLAGSNTTFSVVATGQATLLYQWSLNGGNLTNSAHVAGATSTNLTLIGVVTADAGNYQVTVSNSHGSVTSSNAALTVLIPAAITSQPTNQAVVLTSNATFTVTASGTGPLSYQWQRGGTNLSNVGNISGANTTTLNVAGVLTSDGGSYQVIVTNNHGAVTSVLASLTVLVPPSLTVQPTNRVVRLREAVTFSAAGTGTAPLMYRWQKDGTNLVDGNGLSGTGTSSLVISNAQMSHAGNYRITLTNTGGAVISAPATLAIVPIVAWGNGSSGETNVPLTLTNPLVIAAGSSHALAIKSEGTVEGWGYNGNNIATAPPGLTNVVAVAAGDWGYYTLALKGDGTLVSWGNPSHTNLPAGLTNIIAISIGYDHSLALRHDGTVVGWGDNYANKATPPAGLSNVIAIAAGNSHSLALKNDGTVVGWGQTYPNATPAPPDGTTNIIAIAAGAGFSMVLRNDGTMFAWGDNYYGQINWHHTNVTGISAAGLRGFAIQRDKTIVGWGYSRYGEGTPPAGLSNVVAVVGGTYFSLAQVENPADQVQPAFWWLPTSRVLPTGDTFVLNPSIQGSLPMSFQWYFNGAPLAGETNKWLVLQSIQAGQAGDYHLVASNRAGSVTSAVVAVAQTPGIVVPPASQSVLLGSNVTFNATVIGNGPFDYRWFYNGSPLADAGRISGSATASPAIANAQTNDAGSYHLVVTNLYGTTTSTAATLIVVVPAAIITQPTNQLAYTGASVNFAITAGGTSPLNYLWYSNGVPLVNGGRFSGVTTPTLGISGLVTNDSAAYHVIVTNSLSAATSSVVTLTVLDPARITLHPVSQAPLLGSNVTFTVAASGTEPLTYRWYFNSNLLSDAGRISGSSTPTLAIANVQGADVGGYVAVVTNPVSAVTSRIASLTPLSGPMASTRYVSVSNSAPQPPYLNWNTAATNIQDAIDAAVAGDLILVTNGIYDTGGRVVYGGTNRVAVDKPVTVRSVNGASATRIIGGIQIRCVYLGSNSALSGFTITNGQTKATLNEGVGGGVWSEAGGVVSNCVVTGCRTGYFPNSGSGNKGGGIYGATVYASTLINNSANSAGGGAANCNLFDCLVVSNNYSAGGYANGAGIYQCYASNSVLLANGKIYGTSSGGAHQSTLVHCSLLTNYSTYGSGGAQYSVLSNCIVSGNSGPTVGGTQNCTNYNCVVVANIGGVGGVQGGIAYNCWIANNTATYQGGGAQQSVLYNSVLTGNKATNYSGQLAPGGGAYGCQLYNCTVVSNTGAFGVSGGTAYNSIIYYNTINNWDLGSVKFNNCLTFPTSLGVVSTNAPLFVNLAGGDFRLQSNSPCINAGKNAYVTNAIDLDGLPRISCGTVDIGAYEFQSSASVLSYAWAQQNGLPTDGSADFTDADGDGANNWQEWRADTMPTNSASALLMGTATNGVTGLVVSWASVATRSYWLERGGDLGVVPPFQMIATNILGVAGTKTFSDTSATNDGPYFYRVGVQ